MPKTAKVNGDRERHLTYSPLNSAALENMEMTARLSSSQIFESDEASRTEEETAAADAVLSEIIPKVKFTVSSSDDDESDGHDGKELDGSEYSLDDLNLSKFCRDGNVQGLMAITKGRETKWRNRIGKLDENGLSALHYAARFSRHNALVFLVGKCKADVKVKDRDGSTPLHHVARKLQTGATKEIMKVIQYLVKQGADPNAENKFSWTPLHYAAVRGNEVVAKVLLDLKGIKINKPDLNGSTPLHLALTHSHASVALMLLEKEAVPDARDDNNLTPLHLAAEIGNMEVVEALLGAVSKEKLVNFVNETDIDLNTSLHFAVEKRHIAVVQKLISAGANVNVACRPKTLQTTVLHMAAVSGDVDMVDLLLSNGANVLAVDKQGLTPLHLAAQYNRLSVVASLLKNGVSNQLTIRDRELYFTPLLTAIVSDCDPEMLQTFHSYKADITVLDKSERSALFLAAQFNRKKLLEVIIQFIRASGRMSLVNQPDKDGDTPLHIAAANGFIDIVRVLLESQASNDYKNEEEKTPFHKAAEAGRADICKEIIEASESRCLGEEDENSNTALHLAAAKGHLDVVKLLISHGSDKLARNYDNHTPLHLAARYGHLEIVSYLIDEKVPLNPTDRAKLTPMHYAAVYNHAEVVDLLLKNGGDVSKRDAMGRNVLDIAVDSNHYLEYNCRLKFLPAPSAAIQVGAVILRSDQWRIALMNDIRPTSKLSDKDIRKRASVYQLLFKLPLVNDMTKLPSYFNNSNEKRETPLRRIIRKMPDLAKIVFDNCIHKASNYRAGGYSDLSVHVEYNFEFIDDTFAKWNHESGIDNEQAQNALYNENGKLRPDAQRNGSSAVVVKANHPIMLMVDFKRESLLSHPLVTAAIRRKWKFAQVLYLLFLLVYLTFLSLTTAFIVMVYSPLLPGQFNNANFAINMSSLADFENLNHFIFPSVNGSETNCTGLNHLTDDETRMKYIIWLLAAVGVFVEIIQLFAVGFISYFTKMINYLDWFCYSSAIVVTLSFLPCDERTIWQWQLSAFCIFFCWLDLLIFLRRVPLVGIYVVMVEDTFNTFVRFFSIFFLFVLAFAFSFFILLQNQFAFATPFYSIMKTIIMMIGDQDYSNTFFAYMQSGEFHDQLYFPVATYAIYLILLMTLTIVVMNLLTGLAVDNVSGLQENARLKKLGLVIELALEVEQALPLFLMRRLVIGKHKQLLGQVPGNCLTNLMRYIWRLIEGPLASAETSQPKEITQANTTSRLVNEVEERLSREIHQNRHDLKRLSTTVDTVVSRVEQMSEKLDKMNTLLESLLTHLTE